MVTLLSGFHFFLLPFNFMPLDSERIRIRKKRFGFGFGKKDSVSDRPIPCLHNPHWAEKDGECAPFVQGA